MAKVYLAGPDVFFRNCGAIFAARMRACAALGLDALVPVDGTKLTAEAIFQGNVALLDQADAVIANISPFRGPHCDVGTAWEMAYATAKGKPVFAYSSDARPLFERLGAVDADGRDAKGLLAENFALAENLMISVPVADGKTHPTFEAAAQAAATYFGAKPSSL